MAVKSLGNDDMLLNVLFSAEEVSGVVGSWKLFRMLKNTIVVPCMLMMSEP